MKTTLFDLFRSCLDDVLVHGELFYPKLYAFALSLAFLIIAGLISFAFVGVSEPVGFVVGYILLLLWIIVVVSLFFGADLVIVQMFKELDKGRKINKSLCIDNALERIKVYFSALVPINIAKFLLLVITLVPVYLVFSDVYFVELSIQLVVLFVEVIFLLFFVLLPQVVILENKLGVFDCLKKCISVVRNNFSFMSKYLLFRIGVDIVFQLLSALLLVVILVPSAPLFEGPFISIVDFISIAGLFLFIGAVVHVIFRLLINSFLIVLDSKFYYLVMK